MTAIIETLRKYAENGINSLDDNDKNTDRKIVAAACEFAYNGGNVAIMTNDSHIVDLSFDLFMKRRTLKIPEHGRIGVYARFRAPNYTNYFDTERAKGVLRIKDTRTQAAASGK